MPTIQSLVERAVKIVGSQAELARACDVAHPTIYRARMYGQCSPRLAALIEKATLSQVTRAQLLPDLFGKRPFPKARRKQPEPQPDPTPTEKPNAG